MVKSQYWTCVVLRVREKLYVFRFIEAEELLEAEIRRTINEPTQIAVRQAIESAVYALIMEGARNGLWSFQDDGAGEVAVREYEKLLAENRRAG